MNGDEKTLNQGWTYRDRIENATAGQSVLGFYTHYYPHSSLEVWRQRIEAGLIRLDGRTTEVGALLVVGQELSYHRPPWREPEVPRDLSILYEDAAIVAVAKPAGLPVLPGGGFLENTLWAQVGRLYADKPVPIHRLGRGTSGIVVFARSPGARRQLSADLREGRIRKIYRALASGTSMADEFVVREPIGRVSHPHLGYVYAAVPGGKNARTECRVLQRDFVRQQTLLEVDIPTGRPHQIRIHLAAFGHPLVGDPLYGKGGVAILAAGVERTALPGDCGYHLHALQVCFIHPDSGEAVEITCPPPKILSVRDWSQGGVGG
jgi:23S rRNA pseudouridine1911/1915/1917 synthase